MKKQIVLVHGGTTFNTYEEYLHFLATLEASLDYLKKKSWKVSLQEELGNDFDLVKLEMPNKVNAKYAEWKLYFERYIPLFADGVILIGHSLGGIFLSKYLAENEYPKKISGLYLIAAPYDDIGLHESLGDFILPSSLEKISVAAERVFIFNSEDDFVVPVGHVKKFTDQIPKAEVTIFKDKKHFSQPKFPELIKHIQDNY